MQFHQSKSIRPHWLMSFIGAESANIGLTADGLVLTSRSGDKHVVLVESLANQAVFKEGMLWGRLVLETDHGKRTFSGLPKKDGKALFSWMRETWLRQLAPDVNRAAEEIRSVLSGYPRHSRIKAVAVVAETALKRFVQVPEPEWCPDLDISPFQLVSRAARWKAEDIERLCDEYVSRQLNAYSNLFDTVESLPLTELQRKACVVDEDNNLVLAGAGTGKTSVMVGRAGYLTASGQAKPEQILMLAFANEAATEMQERIDLRLGAKGITASTFHKLGKEIIATVEGQQPSLTPLAGDGKALAYQVNHWFEERLKKPEYRKLALEYFEHHLYPEANPFDFESEGAYYDYILANDIRTLKGELVKSLGECLVANYLFKLGIEYQYEAPYEHSTASLEYRQYQPDFYLPDYGVYIEYYGTDRYGNTAPYVNREKYHQGMAWKRALHEEKGTRLIELYHYQHTDGELFDAMDTQLSELDIQYDPLPTDSVLSTLRDFGAVSNFSVLLTDLLKRYRANCYEDGQVNVTISKAENPAQVNAALGLLVPILEDYQQLLDSHGHIDFDDMIGKAIRYVTEGRFKSPWRYIMVDEFQDISEPRARLVKYLRDSVSECSLFCVGDDWQAIYRFTGSDLKFTTAFKEEFGATKVTALDMTFRFNSGIGSVATQFVLKNPTQVKKQLRSLRETTAPAVSVLRASAQRNQSYNEPSRLEKVLARIAELAEPGSTVYILGRYRFNLPDRAELNRMAGKLPSLKLRSSTLHASKGKEADYVVMVGLETGKFGFPSEKVTHPLLDALLPEQESFPHAEERRLFYVGLTRAKHKVYLITDMTRASVFMVELLKQGYRVDFDEFGTDANQKLFHLLKCPKCKTGSLVSRQGLYGYFTGCNKYPLCTYREESCSACDSQIRRVGRFKVCINSECLNWVPVCPKCGAEMARRKGPYGEFWGCRNYRKEGQSCDHTEKEIIFNKTLLESDELVP